MKRLRFTYQLWCSCLEKGGTYYLIHFVAFCILQSYHMLLNIFNKKSEGSRWQIRYSCYSQDLSWTPLHPSLPSSFGEMPSYSHSTPFHSTSLHCIPLHSMSLHYMGCHFRKRGARPGESRGTPSLFIYPSSSSSSSSYLSLPSLLSSEFSYRPTPELTRRLSHRPPKRCISLNILDLLLLLI